jgi:predicted nuclease with TOPRIM domain
MNDILKEALKDIPTIKSNLSISAYGSIDLDELNKAVERLNKIPNYDDLMKENNKLQSNWNSLREWLEKVVKLTANIDEKMTCKNVLDKMNELERKDKECF